MRLARRKPRSSAGKPFTGTSEPCRNYRQNVSYNILAGGERLEDIELRRQNECFLNRLGALNLFRSHKDGYENGEQLRDFIYVKDVIEVCFWLMLNKPVSAIYNLGTGEARSFHDLVRSTFAGLDLQPDIEYIDIPEDIRDRYQYFTEADMAKLKTAGYTKDFYTLEKGVDGYVRNYLDKKSFY
jgi:ADP-L-glycero-D-manno-heptose 6-epimerase